MLPLTEQAPGQGSGGGGLRAVLLHDSLISTTAFRAQGYSSHTGSGGKESSRPYGGALKNAAPDLGSADVTGSVH